MIRQKEKQERILEATSLNQDRNLGDEQFEEYMNNIANESWAKNNIRIQKYVKEHALKKKHYTVAKDVKDTHSRIGFAGHSYEKIDLVGTNEICRGSYPNLDLNGSKMTLNDKKKTNINGK